METLTPQSTVGDVAAQRPASVRVFMRHGIDFCCGGGQPLAAVCARKGLDARALLDEIDQADAPLDDAVTGWAEAPLTTLISHIVTRYHRPLPEELARLEELAARVVERHGARDPRRLPALYDTVIHLRADLRAHLIKEEQVLFPWILSGQPMPENGPVPVLLEEHRCAGEHLGRIRELTGGFVIPEGACAKWRALWQGLEQLERDLQLHLHLENNVLFPRVQDR